jgi:hypothetical protein
MAMLLVEPNATGQILDATLPNGIPQHYIKNGSGMSPLAQGSVAENDSAVKVHFSRYDLAGTSISGFKEILANNYAPPATTLWWRRMMLDDADPSVTPVVAAMRRFHAVPYVKKPLDSKDFASMGPIFLPGCAQFMVEFAGDFLTQDSTGTNIGKITAYGPDGETDFVAVGPTNQESKQIRWYGMPRDTDKDGHIWGTVPSGAPTVGTNAMVDVVPLRDVLTAASITPTIVAPDAFIEREWPTPAPVADYLVPGAISPGMVNQIDDARNYRYQVAWGPDRANMPYPSMIRITIVLEDPNGRLVDPPSYEYVFRLK